MLESQAVHEIPPVLRMNFWGTHSIIIHVIPISVDEIQKNIPHFGCW